MLGALGALGFWALRGSIGSPSSQSELMGTQTSSLMAMVASGYTPDKGLNIVQKPQLAWCPEKCPISYEVSKSLSLWDKA